MKLLLLGADGQVGFELQRTLAPLATVIPATLTGRLADGRACGRSDFSDLAALEALLLEARPDWIANAAAYTAVDKAEDEPAIAERINAEAVAVLGRYAQKQGAAVLHFSTDYVFPGNAARPYRENDATGPINVYGRSKLAGELALGATGCKHLILRTAWVYGARGHNFLLTMLKLARTRDKLNVVDDQRGTPTPARLLATISALAIARIGGGEGSAAQTLLGTYHATAAGETTWCGFAREIVARALDAGVLPRAPRVEPIASRDFPTKAARPGYSVLDSGRIEQAFGLVLPDWREALATVIGELAEQSRAA